METLMPHGSEHARTVGMASTYAEDLLQGIWTYPSTTVGPGHWNLSIIAFDIPFFVLLFLGSLLMMGTNSAKRNTKAIADNMKPEAINKLMEYCTAGGPQGSASKWSGLSRNVAFFKLEQVITWTSVATLVAFVSFKIICGATGVNASSILLVFIIGLMMKFYRQQSEAMNATVPQAAGKGARRVPQSAFLAPTLIALAASIVTFIAYTDCIGTKKTGADGKRDAGQQSLFISAGLIAFIGMVWKMALTLSEDASTADKTKSYELFKNLVTHEFMYYMTGWDCVMLTVTLGSFVLTEAVLVAYAATAYYAFPFYILLFIPAYFMCTNIVHVVAANSKGVRKLTVGPLFFNLLLCALATGIIILTQMQVCSMPHPSKLGHAGKMCAPVGLHYNSNNDLKMHEAPVIALGCITTLFLLLIMAGTTYTNSQMVRTVNDVCSAPDNVTV
jgi:hypothetical protein